MAPMGVRGGVCAESGATDNSGEMTMFEINEFESTEEQPDGSVLISGSRLMVVPEGGPATRSIDLHLKVVSVNPGGSFSVVAVDERRGLGLWPNSAPGPFVIANVQFHREAGFVGCKIEARSLWKGQSSNARYVCNYVISARTK
jgi:hypothetical protein